MSKFYFLLRKGEYLGSNTGSGFPMIWQVNASPFLVLITIDGGTVFPLNLCISGFLRFCFIELLNSFYLSLYSSYTK